jgi:hypothetical protein
MTESRNRDLATSIGAAVASDNIATDGTLAISGVVTYTNLSDLPSSGVSAGDLGFVTANNGLYIRGSSGWYVIALVNTSPTYSTPPASSYDLAKDGSTTTAITIVATDPEGFTITYSVTADSGFNGLATVSQSSNVFTVTPKAEGVATTESGTLTFRATDGVNNTDVVSTFTLTFVTTIQNSAETVLLAKASGNSGTNSSFTDNSSNSHTITTTGNTLASSFSPYRSGGYSAYFDGSGDYLSIADSTDFTLGSGDFTAECWVYPTASPSQPVIFGQWSNPYSWAIEFSNDSNRNVRFLINDGTIRDNVSSTSVPLNNWAHLALVRNGSTFTMYVNGVSVDTYTSSASLVDATGPVTIGAQNGGGSPYQGYITDARLVKGTAVYTSDFTAPSERLTAITNTSLLACHLPYFADGSTNSHTITVAGNTKVEPLVPYDYNPYSASNHGGSALFDGTGDYLSIADSTDFNMGSGDFTVECWFYATDGGLSGAQAIMTTADTTDNQGFWMGTNGTNTYFLVGTSGSWSNFETGSATLYKNQWYHLALVRNGNSFKVYLNGVQDSSTTSTVTLTNTNNLIRIGGRTVNSQYFNGYVADARVVKGTAVYTSAFTPPTEPLSAVTNTSLLALQGDASIFDAAQINDLTLNGGVSSSTAQTKNASSSMYFDGSGDYIAISNLSPLGSGNFTIEFWLYNTNNSGSQNVFDTRTGSTGYTVNISTGGQLGFYSEIASGYAVQSSSSALSTNTWYHIAIVRRGSNMTLFIDGASADTGTNSNNFTSTVGTIGARYSRDQQYFTGYIEDFRITEGLSRYPFVPPEKTLTAITNTSLLTAHAATIIDGSTNAHTITANGDAAVSSFAPFTAGKSVYFDGSGDYLSVADDDTLEFGSGNFTIEAWVYPTSIDSSFSVIVNRWDSASTKSYLLALTSSAVYFYYSTTGSNQTLRQWSETVPLNQWTHLAVVRNGDNLYLFVNGRIHSTTNTLSGVTLYGGTSTTKIGILGDLNSTTDFTGYISNLRVVKGTAVYTNSFTPPTAQLEG